MAILKLLPFLAYLVLLFLPHRAFAKRARKVFVHYVPWYDAAGYQLAPRSGWCYPDGGNYDCSNPSAKAYSNEPLIGEYSILDDNVLEFQLLQMFVTGIDGVIININPESNFQRTASVRLVQRIKTLHEAYPSFDFKYIVSYDSKETNQATILNYMTWTHTSLYASSDYAQYAFHDDETGKAVYITWSESDPEYYYSTVRSLFVNNVLLIIRNARNYNVSDGNMEWVNDLNHAPPKDNIANYGQGQFAHTDWNMARQSEVYYTPLDSVNNILLGSVYPGFDDVNVPAFWNGGTNRYIHRDVNDGETLSLLWQRHIDYVPFRLGGTDEVDNPWIQIVTWNDWPEGTSIEPATQDTYGYRPLITCHDRIPKYKRESTPRFDISFLYTPHQIYRLRTESNDDAQADAVLSAMMATLGSGVGSGDPHFSGFDHSKFDFHGVHQHNYVVFARKESDILVARVRATPELFKGGNKTYFHEFGLQPGATKSKGQKLRFFLTRNYNSGSNNLSENIQWELECSVDGKKTRQLSTDTFRLTQENSRRIKVVTMHHTFRIRGISLSSKYRHHLDFDVSLRHVGFSNGTRAGMYTGILGMTLNRRLGRMDHQRLITVTRYKDVQFEFAMREHYHVSRLFPGRCETKELYKKNRNIAKRM